jgi:cytochrome c-type biogenesis protein CcmH
MTRRLLLKHFRGSELQLRHISPSLYGALAPEEARLSQFKKYEIASRRRAAFLSMSALLLFAAIVIPPFARAQQTDRAKAIGQKLMCVCGCNQILTACNHVGCKYSHTMLQELDQLVTRNESDDLILQAFVQEYGPTVLAEPPTKGFDWAAWIVPIVVPIIALFLVWEVVRRWRHRASLAPAGGPPISPELLARAHEESEKESDD